MMMDMEKSRQKDLSYITTRREMEIEHHAENYDSFCQTEGQ